MRVGFSLSPGGLLLPYHLGVLDGLQYHGFLTQDSPIAGSSAGAIAVAAHACGVDSQTAVDATIDISHRCGELGGARGKLMPLLKEKLNDFIDEDAFEASRDRDLVIAYRELLPRNMAIHQTEFSHKDDLINAVCHSSMFPFFTTNWPVAIDTSRKVPRVVVDGFFAVPRSRFGCPDFEIAGIDVDRTVSVSPFPRQSVSLHAPKEEDCICPEETGDPDDLLRLLRLATQSSSAAELSKVYESGFEDAERWCRTEITKIPANGNEKVASTT